MQYLRMKHILGNIEHGLIWFWVVIHGCKHGRKYIKHKLSWYSGNGATGAPMPTSKAWSQSSSSPEGGTVQTFTRTMSPPVVAKFLNKNVHQMVKRNQHISDSNDLRCQFQFVAISFGIFQSSKTNPPSSPNHSYLVSTNPTVSVIEVFLHPHHPLSAPALPPAPTDRRSEAKSSEFPKAAISKNVIPPACSFQSQSWVSPWVFRSKPRKGYSKTFPKKKHTKPKVSVVFYPHPLQGGGNYLLLCTVHVPRFCVPHG